MPTVFVAVVIPGTLWVLSGLGLVDSDAKLYQHSFASKKFSGAWLTSIVQHRLTPQSRSQALNRQHSTVLNPFWSRVVPSVAGTAPHARGILIEFAQPKGD